MAIVSARLTPQLLNKYIEKVTEPIYPQAKMLGVLKAHGRISMKHDEGDIRWRVRHTRREPTPIQGYPVTIPFEAPVRHTEAILPWRAYAMGEYISRQEKLVGRRNNVTALPTLVENVIKWNLEDFKHYMQRVIYTDGDADPTAIHGLESMFSTSGLISGVPVANPNDVYATVSTALGGAQGGSWTSGTWPEGSGDTQYCFWSPIVVDWSNSAFAVSEETDWEHTWKRAIRYGITWLSNRQSVDAKMVVMNPALLLAIKDSSDEMVRIQATAKSPVVDLGIQTLNFEGVELLADPHCPENTAYILDPQYMELRCLQDQLVEVREDTDPYNNDTIYMDFHGNLRFESPAYFVKLTPVSTVYSE